MGTPFTGYPIPGVGYLNESPPSAYPNHKKPALDHRPQGAHYHQHQAMMAQQQGVNSQQALAPYINQFMNAAPITILREPDPLPIPIKVFPVKRARVMHKFNGPAVAPRHAILQHILIALIIRTWRKTWRIAAVGTAIEAAHLVHLF